MTSVRPSAIENNVTGLFLFRQSPHGNAQPLRLNHLDYNPASYPLTTLLRNRRHRCLRRTTTRRQLRSCVTAFVHESGLCQQNSAQPHLLGQYGRCCAARAPLLAWGSSSQASASWRNRVATRTRVRSYKQPVNLPLGNGCGGWEQSEC